MNEMKPIVMICDKNFVQYTCVALMSLKINKRKETKYDIYVILVDCSKESAELVKSLEDKDFIINIINREAINNTKIEQVAHVSQAALIKFNLCDMITQYDKILYLDGDLIIKDDLSELFDIDLEDNYLACAIHSIAIITNRPKLNSGVMLLNATKIRNEKLSRVFVKTREDLGSRSSMDQETFHIVFNNKLVRLNPKYNVMVDKISYEKKFYSIKDYNKYFGTSFNKRSEIIDNASILHYTGAIKPWKYSFAPCAKQWQYYYKKMYGEKSLSNLKLKSYTTYLKEKIHKEGIRAIYRLSKDKCLEFIGDHFEIYLDKNFEEWK